MISRRFFAGCALCVAGLKATNVSAQSPGLVRNQLNRIEEPGDKLATIQMLVDIDANFYVPPHTHPGVETAYILEGGGTFQMKGKSDRAVGPGEARLRLGRRLSVRCVRRGRHHVRAGGHPFPDRHAATI